MKNKDQVFNYLKHLSTLCTGSILLIVTFNEKLALLKTFYWLVPISILAFLVSLGASFYLYTMLTFPRKENDTEDEVDIYHLELGFFKFVTISSFYIGISSLVFYVVLSAFWGTQS